MIEGFLGSLHAMWMAYSLKMSRTTGGIYETVSFEATRVCPGSCPGARYRQAGAWSGPEQGRWIDLTHAFSERTIYWPTAEGFKHEAVFEGYTEKGSYYSAYNFSAAEHGGTHIDAPIHFAEGRKSVDQLEIDQLIGSAVVVDVTEKTRFTYPVVSFAAPRPPQSSQKRKKLFRNPQCQIFLAPRP
jgi:hypothetical protein